MKRTLSTLLCLACAAAFGEPTVIKLPEPPPKPGQKSVLELRCDPIPNVRVAFVGAGNRGFGAIRRFAHFPKNATIVAVSDLYQKNIDKVKDFLKKGKYQSEVTYSTDPNGWKQFCERPDVDLIYCTTPPGLHAPVAVYAMKHGKHVVVEVPFANKLDEYWEIVDTAEQTQRHCMMLENCIYHDYLLAVKNMIDSGLFGEPVYVEGAYLHDLRDLHFEKRADNWRLYKGSDKMQFGGNTYPTHGLGGPAFWLGINHGDRMLTINSVSTGCFSTRDYVARKFGKDDPLASRYFGSDINTSMVRTAKDKVIVLYHATNSPGPYSLGYKLIGTRGYTHAYPKNAFSFDPNAHTLISDEAVKTLLAKYRHQVYNQFVEFSDVLGGHGGIDTTMDLRLIYCLNNGLPLDMTVYDGASWSSLIAASRKSVENFGAPVEIPDFTRGKWNTVKKVVYHMADPKKEIKLEFAGFLRPMEPAPVATDKVEFTDPEGDWSDTAAADFVKGGVSVSGKELVISYTSAKPLDPKKMRWNVKALISVGSEGGFDNQGALYMAENWRFYKYDAPSPGIWKWKQIGEYKQNVKGNQCSMIIPLELIENLPNRIGVRLRQRYMTDDVAPDMGQLPAVVCYGNMAMDPKTVVETSATRDDYDKKALNDGQIDRRLPWRIAAWASTEDKTDKFASFSFAAPTKLKRAIIYWESVPAKFSIEVGDGGTWKSVAEVKPNSDVSVVDLSGAGEVKKLRVVQKAGEGHSSRPELMWVREIELYK